MTWFLGRYYPAGKIVRAPIADDYPSYTVLRTHGVQVSDYTFDNNLSTADNLTRYAKTCGFNLVDGFVEACGCEELRIEELPQEIRTQYDPQAKYSVMIDGKVAPLDDRVTVTKHRGGTATFSAVRLEAVRNDTSDSSSVH